MTTYVVEMKSLVSKLRHLRFYDYYTKSRELIITCSNYLVEYMHVYVIITTEAEHPSVEQLP